MEIRVIRTVVVDDHAILREGVCVLLQRCRELEIVGQAGDGLSAVELVNRLSPELVIMDIRMPCLNGIEAMRQMVDCHPHLKVLVLSGHSEINLVIQTFMAGGRGYILKKSAFSEMEKGIRAILEGRLFLCCHILKAVTPDFINMLNYSEFPELDKLSFRQREVVRLVAEGYTSKEIAGFLEIASKTVESHREHIMKKLRLGSIPELTKYAVRNGLTSL